MGTIVNIDDNLGHTYYGWPETDSKHFAYLLNHKHFWRVLEQVFQVSTQQITFVVGEQVVPNKHKHTYPNLGGV